MTKKINVEKYKQLYRAFVENKETVTLSFIDEEGRPFSSCTPFVEKDNKLYVYISEVAEHFQLMEKSELVDALVIADEADSNNRFATERARWLCQPKKLGNTGYDDVFHLFDEKFGKKLMDVLRSLDFSLFELNPGKGRYVVGFGLAFDTEIDGSHFTHVTIDHERKGE